MKYAFIERNQETFTVTRMCKMMGVSQSTYYDWLKRPESARSLEDKRLGEEVKESHEKSRETYGARRISQDLVEDGELISRTRVGRLMKLQGLESKSKRKFKATTNSHHGRPVAPNLLEREFMVEQPDTVYAGDITYIPTAEGWLYLAVMIDFYQKTIKEQDFICSMSRKGNCWDNAPSESFFHTLKTELTHHRHSQTRQEAK